jgi:hypothetical protein
MSQAAAIRVRKRFAIKFRDVAVRGRSIFPKSVSAEKSAARLRSVIEKQQKMSRKKS